MVLQKQLTISGQKKSLSSFKKFIFSKVSYNKFYAIKSVVNIKLIHYWVQKGQTLEY